MSYIKIKFMKCQTLPSRRNGLSDQYTLRKAVSLGLKPKGLRSWLSMETWDLIRERAEIKFSLNDALTHHRRSELITYYRGKKSVTDR